VLVTAALLAACGGGAETVRETQPGERVAAPERGAPRYATTPTDGPVVGDEHREAVERGIRAAAEGASVTLTGDGRLAKLASWTADNLGAQGSPPPREVLEFFAHHLGLVEPVPHLLILGQPDPATLEGGVADSVSQFLARQTYNYYGASVFERNGLTVAIIMLATRFVELEPVPRALPAEGPIPVQGRLLGAFDNPSFAVTMPDGEVERVPAGSGPSFQVQLPTRGAGVYKVELLAQGARGDTVVANFPVFVGRDAPNEVVLRTHAGGASGSPAEVREALMGLLNETRSQAGVPPVELHAGLGEVAAAHSRDMVDHGFVGHASPTTGEAPDRVEAAGYRSGLILENIGRGYTAQEIHDGLMESPGHRANLLNRDVTHVGIGVASEPEGSRTAYVATQVFIRMNREIDVAEAPRTLLARINDGRHARRAEPLEADPNLTRAASEAARSYFADPEQSQQDTVDQASGSLRRFAIAFRRVGGLMAVVSDIEEAARLEPAFDPSVRYVGIGVAQGNRPDAPPNSIAVVIMLGWPRQ